MVGDWWARVKQHTVMLLIVTAVCCFPYAFMPSPSLAHKCLWQTFILCFILKSNLWLNVNDIEFSQCARIFYQFEHFSKKHTKTHCFPWISNKKHVCTLSFMHSVVTRPVINPCVGFNSKLLAWWQEPSRCTAVASSSCFCMFSGQSSSIAQTGKNKSLYEVILQLDAYHADIAI